MRTRDHGLATDDRASAQALATAFPDIGTAAQELRRFMHRAVRYLVTGAGHNSRTEVRSARRDQR